MVIQDLEHLSAQNIQDNADNTENKVIEICSICKKPIKGIYTLFGVTREVQITCDCIQEKQNKELQEQQAVVKHEEIQNLKSMSLIGKRYQNVSFKSTVTGRNPSFDTAYERCKKYCKNYKQCLANGYSIYIYGDIGTGKTHLTACIANELLAKCIPVLFTNLFEISKKVKSTFARNTSLTEQKLIQEFSEIEVLIIDDFGTENFIKSSNENTWLQSLLFDLINSRYNSQKATIFSSNYSFNDLINHRGVSQKTVDRIFDMTNGAIMRITGKEFRGQLNNNLPF